MSCLDARAPRARGRRSLRPAGPTCDSAAMVFIPPDLLNEKDPEKRKNIRRAGLVGLGLLLLLVLGVVVALVLDWNRSASRSDAGADVLHKQSALT